MVRRVTTRIALLMSSIVLVACSAEHQAQTGTKVLMTFKEKTMTEYLFVLANPTSRSIYFRGTKWLWLAPKPTDRGFDCKNERNGEMTVGGFPLFDGGKDPPPIEVPPGKEIRLRVEAEALKNNKGEACQLHLMLWQPGIQPPQGEVVESQFFQS